MGIDTRNPLGGLQSELNFTPGGNPYSSLNDKGLAGLGDAYGLSYNSALKANQQNYNNVISGYKTLASNVGDILGQGGSWGVATPGAQAIADTQARETGGNIQNSINRGIGSSTAAVAAQRGANFDTQKAYASLAAQLAQTFAGYTSGIGQGMLGAMQGTQIPYPNASEYSGLYQQYGQQQADTANRALMAQQQVAQQEMARRVFSANLAAASGGGGGGGATIAPRPRGGTYGSGGGGFPSGSANLMDVATSGGLATGGIKYTNMFPSGQTGPIGIGASGQQGGFSGFVGNGGYGGATGGGYGGIEGGFGGDMLSGLY